MKIFNENTELFFFIYQFLNIWFDQVQWQYEYFEYARAKFFCSRFISRKICSPNTSTLQKGRDEHSWLKLFN